MFVAQHFELPLVQRDGAARVLIVNTHAGQHMAEAQEKFRVIYKPGGQFGLGHRHHFHLGAVVDG